MALKYQKIEGYPEIPWNLDTKEHQRWIKDFLWRIVEELCEAEEYIGIKDQEELFYEELSDVVHFIVDIMVALGWSADYLVSTYIHDSEMKELLASGEANDVLNVENFRKQAYGAICNIGWAANCLKNKPWKQTQVLTDRRKFESRLVNAFYWIIQILGGQGFKIEDIYILYMKKHAINKFRQDTNY